MDGKRNKIEMPVWAPSFLWKLHFDYNGDRKRDSLSPFNKFVYDFLTDPRMEQVWKILRKQIILFDNTANFEGVNWEYHFVGITYSWAFKLPSTESLTKAETRQQHEETIQLVSRLRGKLINLGYSNLGIEELAPHIEDELKVPVMANLHLLTIDGLLENLVQKFLLEKRNTSAHTQKIKRSKHRSIKKGVTHQKYLSIQLADYFKCNYELSAGRGLHQTIANTVNVALSSECDKNDVREWLRSNSSVAGGD